MIACKYFLLLIISFILYFGYLKSIISIILSESSSNFLSEIISNAPYHFLFFLFLQTAFSGNFFHKYSKSLLYLSFIYLITYFACSLLNTLGIVHFSIIFFNSFSYSSLTFLTNSPVLS